MSESTPSTRIDASRIPEGNAVLELIRERLESCSRPQHRSPQDKAKLALVIEGGGMRGVVSAGMVTALDQLGVRDVFDIVVGASAGALAGAFYLAGRPAVGTSLYYEDLTGKDWLDYRRALRRQPIIGLDWLIDTLVPGPKGFPAERVISSDIPLHAIATRITDYTSVVLDEFGSPGELRNVLRASARMPIVSGKPVPVGDESYLDGSVSESIPIGSAVDELGATHVLALLTRPVGQLRGRPSFFSKAVVFPVMNRLVPGLGDAYSKRAARYTEELRRVAAMEAGEDPSAAACVIQLPAGTPRLGQVEQGYDALFAAAAAGARAVYLTLTGEERGFYAGLDLVP